MVPTMGPGAGVDVVSTTGVKRIYPDITGCGNEPTGPGWAGLAWPGIVGLGLAGWFRPWFDAELVAFHVSHHGEGLVAVDDGGAECF